ncbi:MAG: type II toxin-antitoxin system HicB family antitoxin [bacterium]|nr:type II toxin-antitoxin system HicB family antitoxin [bacterium]
MEQDEGGYFVATVPALKSCYTQAKKLEDLYPRIKEVIELCLQEEKPAVMKFVSLQQVQVAV